MRAIFCHVGAAVAALVLASTAYADGPVRLTGDELDSVHMGAADLKVKANGVKVIIRHGKVTVITPKTRTLVPSSAKHVDNARGRSRSYANHKA